VPLAADHQMVADGDAQRLGRRLDLARHLDVVARFDRLVGAGEQRRGTLIRAPWRG
jgi:hypothetical protein